MCFTFVLYITCVHIRNAHLFYEVTLLSLSYETSEVPVHSGHVWNRALIDSRFSTGCPCLDAGELLESNPFATCSYCPLPSSSRSCRRSSQCLWLLSCSLAFDRISSLLFFLLLYSLPTHSLSNAQHVSILCPLTSLSLLSSALLSSALASVRVTSGTSSLPPPASCLCTRYARPVHAASTRIALRSPTTTPTACERNGRPDSTRVMARYAMLLLTRVPYFGLVPRLQLVSSLDSHSRRIAPSSCVIILLISGSTSAS